MIAAALRLLGGRALPIADLAPDSPPDAVLRAYAATVETLMGAVDERDALLNGYRTGD
jgi:hypothetical protein